MNTSIKPYWELLSRHIRPQRGRFFLLTALLLGNIGLQIVNPQIMRAFIDAALGGQAAGYLTSTALAFIGIALFQQFVSVSVTYLGENVAWTATNALRAELAQHCLRLDMSFHNDHTPGELIERIDGDISELANFFSQFVVLLASNLLLLIGILAALWREDWRAGLAFVTFAALALFALSRVREIAVPFQKARRQAEAELFGFVEEQLAGTEDVRSSGAVSFSIRELYRLQANILRHNRRAELRGWLIGSLTGILMLLGNVLAVTSGYLLFSAGMITIGTVYLFVHYINQLDGPLWMLTHQVQSFQAIGACVERLNELRRMQPKVNDGESAANGQTGQPLEVTFENVGFAYNGGDAVLRGISFRLGAGKTLGLLGRTGSGKTTLARLIFRLYDPSTGQICFDDADIRRLKLDDLHRRVALVTQDVQLFRASVRDNLTFFDRAIPDSQILAVLDELELTDWFRKLPQGLDTELEAGGRSLSAGEAQLLALARVFLRNPGLVILDEASSRLDPATEQHIERAIDRLLQGRSAIIIAHRLGTVQRADEVMILENGDVREYGNRRQLAADPASRFYSLLQTGLEEVLA